jgi:hypothetical protein
MKAENNNTDVFLWQSSQEGCTHCQNVEAQADVKQVQANVAVAAAGLDPATLRKK